MINGITETGELIPKRWNVGRLILLPKPGKNPKLPNAYRSISILPALSKVWEKCLKLLTHIVDATTQVMNIADSCNKKGQM